MLHHFLRFIFFVFFSTTFATLNSCEHAEIATFLTFHLHFFWCCKPTPWSHTDASEANLCRFGTRWSATCGNRGNKTASIWRTTICHSENLGDSVSKNDGAHEQYQNHNSKRLPLDVESSEPFFSKKHSLVVISTLLAFLKNAIACSNSVSESETASFLFLLHAGEAPPLFLQKGV